MLILTTTQNDDIRKLITNYSKSKLEIDLEISRLNELIVKLKK